MRARPDTTLKARGPWGKFKSRLWYLPYSTNSSVSISLHRDLWSCFPSSRSSQNLKKIASSHRDRYLHNNSCFFPDSGEKTVRYLNKVIWRMRAYRVPCPQPGRLWRIPPPIDKSGGHTRCYFSWRTEITRAHKILHLSLASNYATHFRKFILLEIKNQSTSGLHRRHNPTQVHCTTNHVSSS